MIKFRVTWAISLCALFLASWQSSQNALADSPPDPDQAVRRYDPNNQNFQIVAPEKVIPGKIYNHYSASHGRYVWAFALEGGGFSYALGQGTTEFPRNFDLATSESETKDLIASQVGDWVKVSESQGRQILVRLQPTGLWQILQIGSVRSHYDLDTGRRWEWHGKRRVAVGHTNGHVWRLEGNKYVPGNSWPHYSVLPVNSAPLCACDL